MTKKEVVEMLNDIDYRYELKGDADWLMNEILDRLENMPTSSQTEKIYSEEDLREALFLALNIDRTTCCTTRTTDSIVREVIKMYYNETYGSKGSETKTENI